MLVYAVATMGKFAVLTPVLAWVVIQGVQGRLPVKKLVLLGCGTFFLMMAAHFVRAGSADDGTTILDVLAVYIYSPIVALGYMDIPSVHQWGSHVFRFFYAVGASLGVLSEPVDVILPYVNIPNLTNVYTVIQPFYHDFSLAGVAIGAVVYGVFFSVLFFFACRGRGFFLVLYSGLAIALFGQFFGELFFMMFSGYLQIFLVLLFIFAISKKEKNVC
jgi:oligosaccharide repeat unit polymerase